MAAAVLPARDYLASSYRENKSQSGAMACSSAQKPPQSKRKLIGGNPDYGKRKLDQQFVGAAKSCHIGKKWSILSHSASFVAPEEDKLPSSISSMRSPTSLYPDLAELPRPLSTPPPWNAGRLSFQSISCGYRSVRTSGERNPAKHSFPYNPHNEAEGKPDAVLSHSSDCRRIFKNKRYEDSQAELVKGANGNLKAVSTLEKTEISFRKDIMIERRTDTKPGRNLVMGQVTILKRGEIFKSFVEAEPDSGNRPQGKCERASVRLKDDGIAVNSAATAQMMKIKAVGASKSVSKASSCEDIHPNKVAQIMEADADKPCKVTDDLVITSTERIGPDPSVLPKEGSGILRPVSSGISVPDVMGDDAAISVPGFGSGKLLEGGDCLKACSDENLKVSTSLVFDSEGWSGPAFSNSPSPSCLPLPKFCIQRPTTTQGVNTGATLSLRRLLGLD